MSKRRSKTEDELDDDALMLLVSPEADRFARALDRHGWMIVVKPEVRAEHLAAGAIEPGPWSMKTPGPCPAWAEPHDAWLPERKPVLTLIDGGKDTGSLNQRVVEVIDMMKFNGRTDHDETNGGRGAQKQEASQGISEA